MNTYKSCLLLAAAAILSACKTTPEAPLQKVEIEPQVIKTCTEISALTRVDIPAKTETFFAITEIENPGYDPIQRTEKQVRVVEEAQTIFVDSNGRQVTDICDTQIDPNAPTEVGRQPGT